MPYIKTSGPNPTELYYYEQGEGKPVVLVHGWPLSHRMWESQITALSEAGYRVIAYDRRGFGQSGRPTAGYDYDTFAADLAAVLTQLDLSDVALAGFSMGGGEVARYLGRHGASGRVTKAMLLGAVPPFLLKTADNPGGVDKAVFDGMLESVRNDRIAFLGDFFYGFYNLDRSKPEGQELVAFSKWLAWAASPLATQQCIVAFGTTDFRADLAQFAVPTLVVHGDADQIVPVDVSGRRSHEMIKGSRLEVLPGAPHGFAATHARQLNALMLDFLRS